MDVVIVSHDCRELLADCLASLGPESHIVVVDNASRDGTVGSVRTAYPNVDLVPLDENRGFAAATNLGIARTTAPYVLALNPDTVLPSGAVDALARVLDEHPEVGICGPKLIRRDGSLDHAARRSFPTITSSLGHFLGFATSYRAPHVEYGPVDAVNGAFMLIRRAALDEVGMFDEGYWMYMEDLDLCYRFARVGWVTWYEPSVSVVHVKHGSAEPTKTARLNIAFHRGMARFYRKHYAPKHNAVVNAVVYTGIALKLAVSLVRRR